MTCPLSQVGQNLSQLGDHNVVGGERGLGLKDRDRQMGGHSDYRKQVSPWDRRHLHAGTVSLAADQRGWDVRVSEFVVQVHHVGHPARQEELVPLLDPRPEDHPEDVPA